MRRDEPKWTLIIRIGFGDEKGHSQLDAPQLRALRPAIWLPGTRSSVPVLVHSLGLTLLRMSRLVTVTRLYHRHHRRGKQDKARPRLFQPDCLAACTANPPTVFFPCTPKMRKLPTHTLQVPGGCLPGGCLVLPHLPHLAILQRPLVPALSHRTTSEQRTGLAVKSST